MRRTRLTSLSGKIISPRYELKNGICRIGFYTVDPDPKKEKLIFSVGPDDLFDAHGNRFDIDVELFPAKD